MFISKLQITNFKGFIDYTEIEFSDKVNFIIGNNNAGKSTIFEALAFLENGLHKGENPDELKNYNAKNKTLEVVAWIKGDFSSLIKASSKDLSMFIKNNTIKLIRTDEPLEWHDAKNKIKSLNIKEIGIYNWEKDEYQNPAGIDKTLNLLVGQYIWATTNMDEVGSFNKTKIAGKLLESKASEFFNSDEYKNFIAMHKKLFDDEDGVLQNQLDSLKNEISKNLSENYGQNLKVKIEFEAPDTNVFKKNCDFSISESENNYKPLYSYGDGLQRSVALALIEAYANLVAEEKSSNDSLFFVVDEPEVYLHPKGQENLANAFVKLSTKSQIFIATHSPYMIANFRYGNDQAFIVKNHKISKIDNSFSKYSLNHIPSFNEINYLAFGVRAIEYHNDLYATFTRVLIEKEICKSGLENIKETDRYITEKNIDTKLSDYYKHFYGKRLIQKNYIKILKDKQRSEMLTLPTYIRNVYHHPEIKSNAQVTPNEVKQSIHLLQKLLDHREDILKGK